MLFMLYVRLSTSKCIVVLIVNIAYLCDKIIKRVKPYQKYQYIIRCSGNGQGMGEDSECRVSNFLPDRQRDRQTQTQTDRQTVTDR